MLLETLGRIVAKQIGIDESEVKLTSDFREDLGIDSLDIFEIVMELEERFMIEIPTEDLEDMKKVADFVEYLEKRLNK